MKISSVRSQATSFTHWALVNQVRLRALASSPSFPSLCTRQPGDLRASSPSLPSLRTQHLLALPWLPLPPSRPFAMLLSLLFFIFLSAPASVQRHQQPPALQHSSRAHLALVELSHELTSATRAPATHCGRCLSLPIRMQVDDKGAALATLLDKAGIEYYNILVSLMHRCGVCVCVCVCVCVVECAWCEWGFGGCDWCEEVVVWCVCVCGGCKRIGDCYGCERVGVWTGGLMAVCRVEWALIVLAARLTLYHLVAVRLTRHRLLLTCSLSSFFARVRSTSS
jgi:hypothetical protein